MFPELSQFTTITFMPHIVAEAPTVLWQPAYLGNEVGRVVAVPAAEVRVFLQWIDWRRLFLPESRGRPWVLEAR